MARLGPSVVKAQVAAGGRGKAGGIRLAATPEEARAAADAILGMTIGGYAVERLLVEQQIEAARKLYAAVLTDAASRGPLILVGFKGGMEIEELARQGPEALLRVPVDIRHGIGADALAPRLAPLGSASPSPTSWPGSMASMPPATPS